MKLLSLVALSLSFLSAATGAPLSEGGRLAKRQNRGVNELLSYISQLFTVDILMKDSALMIGVGEKAFALMAGYSTSEDDLEEGRCGDVVVIFARGTTEPGNVGALAGPPLFDALRQSMGVAGKTVAVQGVEYPASFTGYLQGGDKAGSRQMAALVTRAFQQCPSSKIVMSGYSQGGQVVHNAAKLLPAATMANVSSVIIFGDPLGTDSKYPVQGASPNKVLVTCHLGDNICVNGDLILLPHLTYLEDANTAAAFILARAET
ncbi:cutinase precursor [Apiospora saccharicola]|uniref:Cutinase n=1 Tax=Apiospora saccharicola TaxID=335842 RepID=A0ABR1UPQ9_9PEZI